MHLNTASKKVQYSESTSVRLHARQGHTASTLGKQDITMSIIITIMCEADITSRASNAVRTTHRSSRITTYEDHCGMNMIGPQACMVRECVGQSLVAGLVAL